MFSLAAAVSVLVATSQVATAAAAVSKDESKLKAEITMLNTDAKLPQAEKILSRQLTDNFKVGTDRINSLLGKNLQYGDIAAILAFAEKMPGGITDPNVSRIVTMRQGKTGWDQIASNLKVNITDVVAKLTTIEDDSHRGIKQALAESMTSGMGAGGVDESMDLSGEGAGGPTEDLPEETETPEEFPDVPDSSGSGAGGSVDGHGSGGY